MKSKVLLLVVFAFFLFTLVVIHKRYNFLSDTLFKNSVKSAPALPQTNKFIHSSSDFTIKLKPQETYLKEEKKNIYGVIIPHHLLASSIISETLNHVSYSLKQQGKNPDHIILLSPNHFSLGSSKVITSDGDWKTQYGIVKGDEVIVKKLESFNLARIDYHSIEQEHGIFGLLPFIKYYFPEAKITPLMVESLKTEEINKFSLFLENNLSLNSLIIVSADFTHYLPDLVAVFHDKAAVSSLYNFDFPFIKRMDVDTQSSIAFLLKYLELQQSKRFVLLKNINSSNFHGGRDDITSYVTGYFTQGEKEEKNQATLLISPDLPIDKNIFNFAPKGSNFWLFLRGTNFKIANLRFVPFKDEEIKTTLLSDIFNYLKDRFDIFNISSLDPNKEEFTHLKDFLTKKELDFLCGSLNNRIFSKTIEKNNIKIGLLSCSCEDFKELSKIKKEVASLAGKTDFVVVFLNWQKDSFNKQNEAKTLLDLGADLIIGNDLFCIHPIEVYKEKIIFYDIKGIPDDSKESFFVGIFLEKLQDKTEISYFFFPFKIEKSGVISLKSHIEREKFFEWLAKNSLAKEDIKNSIKKGVLKFIK